jgi:hypothetical protein
MTPSVHPGRSSGVVVRLDRHEKAVLLDLADQTRELVRVHDHGDPVVRRVFPDAYESEDEARNFKEMTEDQLASTKVAALDAITKSLGASRREVSLTMEEAEMWLTALTDMRLALGIRLEVTEEKMSSDIDPSDPEAAALSMLHWLGWLQESMLEALRSA